MLNFPSPPNPTLYIESFPTAVFRDELPQYAPDSDPKKQLSLPEVTSTPALFPKALFLCPVVSLNDESPNAELKLFVDTVFNA